MTEKEPITTQPIVSADSETTATRTASKQATATQNNKTEELEKLPVGLKVLNQSTKVTVKQHIDSVEGM